MCYELFFKLDAASSAEDGIINASQIELHSSKSAMDPRWHPSRLPIRGH